MSKEHPIIYSTPMIKAYMEDRKTMTRRVMKPQPKMIHEIFQHQGYVYAQTELLERDKNLLNGCVRCPYGQPGDALWIRQTFFANLGKLLFTKEELSRLKNDKEFNELAQSSGLQIDVKWTPAIFMPRKWSFYTQTITSIRVERLQDITEEDAEKEGIEFVLTHKTRRDQFATLWDSINAKRGYPWASNPWIWVISYPKYSEEPTRNKKE